MIHSENLEKIFWSNDVETKAVRSVNLAVNKGEFVAIMGPSGCGKSTLLHLVGLLDTPTSGQLLINGFDVSEMKEEMRTKVRRDNIGFVFQNFNLIDELTIFDNIELPLLYHHFNRKERRNKVTEALGRMGIDHLKKHFPAQLSGGQQQRVALARAIIASPKLLLADEPTGNLDSHNRQIILELLSELNSSGTTILMVTHSETDAQYCQRLLHLYDGRIVTENVNKARGA